jgi:dTMP kinase
MTKGKLIVLEGIDGSGTTTQAKILCQSLVKKNIKAELTAEPSEGLIGKLIRNYLRSGTKSKFTDTGLGAHALALLFAADRLDHLSNQINPWLNAGKVVVSDRYLFSSLAYQALDCEFDWIECINLKAPAPDLTLVLDLPAEVGFKRVSQRSASRELFEKLELQKKVRNNYLKFAETLNRKSPVVIIDTQRPIDRIAEEILSKVLDFLGNSGNP